MSIIESTNATVFSLDDASAAASAKSDREATARTARQARHAYGVTELLRDRDELRGIYAPADLVEEFTRWSA